MQSRLVLSTREWLLAAITFAAIVGAMFVAPIPQDEAYHAFVDTRTLLGVPNFWNVFSNVGYLVVGIYGLFQLQRVQSRALQPAYVTFCIGVACVALGSSYYHLAPSTHTLVWDRLPMTFAFMALLCLVLSDRVSLKLGTRLLWPMVVIGVASVFYWAWTESRGAGDLRPYALVQFLPIVLMQLLLLLFPGSPRSAMWLWYTLAGYVAAKLAEAGDGMLYSTLGLSGHSIKHFVSSLAVLFAVFALLEMKALPRR